MTERRSAKLHLGNLITQVMAGIFSLLVFGGSAPAQYVVSTNAGLIQYIDGNVFLEDRLLPTPPDPYLQIENGQSLRTEQGRAELLLSPYAYLRLGENGLLRMEQNKLEDTQLTLVQGAALIEIVRQIKGNRVRICFPTSVVEIKKAGLYRLDASSDELRVYGGAAQVANGNRKSTFGMGRMVRLNGDLSSNKFDVGDVDSLHKWAARRSFDLFMVSPKTRTQSHWKLMSLGWLRNFNFQMSFYSPLAFDAWVRDQLIQEMLEKQPATGAEAREAQDRLLAALKAAAAAQAEANQTQTFHPEPTK